MGGCGTLFFSDTHLNIKNLWRIVGAASKKVKDCVLIEKDRRHYSQNVEKQFWHLCATDDSVIIPDNVSLAISKTDLPLPR